MQKTEERKKVNFMVNKQILLRMDQLIPERKKSDFVNEVLEEAIKDFGRKKASDGMDALARAHKMRMSTEEFVRLKNYGRI